jgi:hypothetical protein
MNDSYGSTTHACAVVSFALCLEPMRMGFGRLFFVHEGGECCRTVHVEFLECCGISIHAVELDFQVW